MVELCRRCPPQAQGIGLLARVRIGGYVERAGRAQGDAPKATAGPVAAIGAVGRRRQITALL